MTVIDPVPAPAAQKSWLPTRKWLTQLVFSAGTAATMAWTGDGINTDSEKTALIGLGVTLVATYITPNKDDGAVGGVPVKGAGL
jgi:hypothetical protein